MEQNPQSVIQLETLAGGASTRCPRPTPAPPVIQPRLAFTIGSYRLADFVHLGLKQLRKLSPDSPILVSDDASPESGHIKNLAEEHGATYRGSTKRRGHFSGDVQAFVNALAFSEAVGADVAVKVSQRFIFRRQEAIDAIASAFEDPNIVMATPGQPKVGALSAMGRPHGFGAFTRLSDVTAIRVGSVSPTEILHMYRGRLITEKVPWGSFVECAIDGLCQRFPERTVKLDQISNHQDIENPAFLRRYQNTPEQYRALAATHGIGGQFMLGEWGQAEGRAYLCKPMCA